MLATECTWFVLPAVPPETGAAAAAAEQAQRVGTAEEAKAAAEAEAGQAAGGGWTGREATAVPDDPESAEGAAAAANDAAEPPADGQLADGAGGGGGDTGGIINEEDAEAAAAAPEVQEETEEELMARSAAIPGFRARRLWTLTPCPCACRLASWPLLAVFREDFKKLCCCDGHDSYTRYLQRRRSSCFQLFQFRFWYVGVSQVGAEAGGAAGSTGCGGGHATPHRGALGCDRGAALRPAVAAVSARQWRSRWGDHGRRCPVGWRLANSMVTVWLMVPALELHSFRSLKCSGVQRPT